MTGCVNAKAEQKATDLHSRTLNLKIYFTLHGIIYSRQATSASNMQILLRAAEAWHFFCIEPDFNQVTCIWNQNKILTTYNRNPARREGCKSLTGKKPSDRCHPPLACIEQENSLATRCRRAPLNRRAFEIASLLVVSVVVFPAQIKIRLPKLCIKCSLTLSEK